MQDLLWVINQAVLYPAHYSLNIQELGKCKLVYECISLFRLDQSNMRKNGPILKLWAECKCLLTSKVVTYGINIWGYGRQQTCQKLLYVVSPNPLTILTLKSWLWWAVVQNLASRTAREIRLKFLCALQLALR